MALPAKLVPPRLARQVVARERLHARLDQAVAAGAVWLGAPAGSGKTTLAAGWAAARRAPLLWYEIDETDADAGGFLHLLREAVAARARRSRQLPGFSATDTRQPLGGAVRAFVRRLCAHLPQGAVLVLDNTERLPPGCEGELVLDALLAECRGAAAVMVLSRQPLPERLARARLDERIAVPAPEELRLTATETRELLEKRHPRAAAAAPQLHAAAEGWCAGVRLLAETYVPGQPLPPRNALFDYIAAELLGALPRERRELLTLMALLPVASPQVAVAVTGRDDSAAVLEELARSAFFTFRLPGAQPLYRLHPLLKEFLLREEARSSGAASRVAVRRRVARALAGNGEAVAAVPLWIELQDWDAIARLLDETGSALLRQSRHRTVLEWTDAMPPSWIAGRPLVALWRARAWVGRDPLRALGELQALWPALEAQAPLPTLVDAWQAVASCHITGGRLFDAWGPATERLLARLEGAQHATLLRWMLAATYSAFARNSPPEWDHAEQAAIDLVCDTSVGIDMRLALGCRMRGGPALWREGAQPLPPQVVRSLRAAALAEGAAVVPRLSWMWSDVVVLTWCGDAHELEETRQLLATAAAIAAEHGVTYFGFPHTLPVNIAIAEGDMPAAARHAAAIRALPPPAADASFERTHRDHTLACYEFAAGRFGAAIELARSALAAARHARSPMAVVNAHCVLSRALAAVGDPLQAMRGLREALRVARRGRVRPQRIGIWLSAAAILRAAGRPGADAATRKAFATMAAAGVLRPVNAVMQPAEFATHCVVAWRAGTHRAWVRHVVAQRGLAAPPGAGAADWPWQVVVRTLGALSLERAGEDIAFGRKPPRKVLELLRYLLVAGERHAPAAQVVDALWPELEGDEAHRAFLTALHRLRKLLGEAAVLHREGRVGLDARVVHVDRATFEDLLGRAPCEAGLRAAIALYGGPFLGPEADGWAITVRDHLRGRFIRAVCDLGAMLAGRGAHADARVLFESALLREPAAEELYQGAIAACAALGLRGEAVALLRRAEQEIGLAFGVAVSPRTRRLAADGANPLPIGDFG
ncbi:BTAD domain-containing putative transcriptional regulator [Ramlibacter albus]|uniref:Bacterial transcriptional activator domain-containing protein n=1 Tax=Ramlibacter albus TaxID=2079448 RepID=A0A923S3B2_9BURK|nr:BTAD domain-containing putative transcriptional regulator [Ramlibacter albus]MBC5766236.1 hypothetical protein [Ramlibacter albus]